MVKYTTDVGKKRACDILKFGLFIVTAVLLYICSSLYTSVADGESSYIVYRNSTEMLEYALMTLAIFWGGSMLYMFTE